MYIHALWSFTYFFYLMLCFGLITIARMEKNISRYVWQYFKEQFLNKPSSYFSSLSFCVCSSVSIHSPYQFSQLEFGVYNKYMLQDRTKILNLISSIYVNHQKQKITSRIEYYIPCREMKEILLFQVGGRGFHKLNV